MTGRGRVVICSEGRSRTAPRTRGEYQELQGESRITNGRGQLYILVAFNAVVNWAFTMLSYTLEEGFGQLSQNKLIVDLALEAAP